jgi:hypothetical protein
LYAGSGSHGNISSAAVTRYGDRAKRLGIEDAIYHRDSLAGAIEAGEARAFGPRIH